MKSVKEEERTEEMDDRQAPTLWNRLFGLLSFSFVDLAGEVLDLSGVWRTTRRWKSILCVIPILILSIVIGALVGIGKLSDKGVKVMWYVDRAEKEVKIATGEPVPNDKSKDGEALRESPPEKEKEQEPLSEEELKVKTDLIDTLFRRVLQLERNNKRALYYIAFQMSRYGKASSARPIMESLAPEKSNGLDMAHAWLASDMIQRALKGEPINRDVLKNHLKFGTVRENVGPGLLVAYGQLLQQDEQMSEAESIVNRAAKYEPKLLLNQIAYYRDKGMIGQAKASADSLIELVQANFDGEKGDESMVLAAQAYVSTDRIDEAIKLMQTGLTKRPRSPMLRRGMSDACRLKFHATTEATEKNVKVNLELLNVAMVADPTNLAVQQELNYLSKLGVGQTEETMEGLRTQIAMNGTSFAARMIIAQSAHQKGDFETAANQYEVILAELPNMTLVLNNLAMLYAMIEPQKPEEALSMIDRAIVVSPNIPEFFDTRGEVMTRINRKPEAVESFKKALEMNPEKLKTREKLISLYDELGQEKEAASEREKLEQFTKIVAEKMEKLQAAQQRQQQLQKQNIATPTTEPTKEPVETKELLPFSDLNAATESTAVPATNASPK
jgi:tetratricopeptide (TPR) repeat protein